MPTATEDLSGAAEALKRAGLSQDTSSYEPEQLQRAAAAPAEMSGRKLADEIMGRGRSGKPAKPRAKYSDLEQAVRERANKTAEGGKPFAAPVLAAQVRRILKAMGGATDPFAEGQPLHGIKVGDAREVAKNGGRSVSTRSVGEWKRSKRAIADDQTLDNRRIVAICVALRAEAE